MTEIRYFDVPPGEASSGRSGMFKTRARVCPRCFLRRTTELGADPACTRLTPASRSRHGAGNRGTRSDVATLAQCGAVGFERQTQTATVSALCAARVISRQALRQPRR